MSQSYESYDAHCLVIRNLSVLEQAPSAVHEAEDRIFSAINEKVKDWTNSKNDWEGVFDFYSGDVGETTIKPVDWEKDENEGYRAYYTLKSDDNFYNSFLYYLSALVGAVPYEMGFWFEGEHYAFVPTIFNFSARYF